MGNETKKDPTKVYENLNKLPLMLWEYRNAMMKTLKDTFVKQLIEAKKEECDYCKKNNIPEAMSIANYNAVCDLITRCSTIFEVEALARYVFDMNEIPSFEDVQAKARDIERVFPWKVKN